MATLGISASGVVEKHGDQMVLLRGVTENLVEFILEEKGEPWE